MTALRQSVPVAPTEEDRIRAAFADDPLALQLVKSGDIHGACMARAVREADLPRELVSCPRGNGPGVLPWLRATMPDGEAYYRCGLLRIGAPGAGWDDCRSINAANDTWIWHKPATKQVLTSLGFPTPSGRDFGSDEAGLALDYFLSRDHAVCVKPVAGNQGVAVFPHVEHPEDFPPAFAAASLSGQRVLVEEHVAGHILRFFFVKPRIVGIRLDIPANVVGDGRSSITDLLERKNVAKALRSGQYPVVISDRETRLLRRQGLCPADVPSLGRRVFLRDVSNSSKGGDSLGRPASLHPSYGEQMARLCNALRGVWVASVDVALSNPAAEARPDNYAVIEVNSAPGMICFHFPWAGEAQDMAGAIVAMLQGRDGPSFVGTA